MQVQQTSVARVAAKLAVGYFENTFTGKITGLQFFGLKFFCQKFFALGKI